MNSLDSLIGDIQNKIPSLELRESELMKNHCSFKIGGPARAMAFPSSIEEAEELCSLLRASGEKPLIIGNGTNLLVTDEPINRFVVKISEKMSAFERRSDTQIHALCGVSLARLASGCAKLSLSGMEFAHGIPGTLGGASSMNAGAYGGEMKDVLRSAYYLDEEARLLSKSAEELELGYRRSVFSDSGCVVLACRLELREGNESEIFSRMRELAEKRRASQPLDMPSAGSTFKRPKQNYAAALIEEAGLKGFSVGAAQVSQKHAGFVVNRGGASFDDVLKLMEHIQKTVYERSGIMLEPELKIIRG